MKTACPSLDSLYRLGGHSLDGEDFDALEAHIAECPGCLERLEQLARAETSDATQAAHKAAPDPLPAIPGFSLGAVLGRGGSGVVYEAIQLRIGRRVAIKVFSNGTALDASSRERWLREARAIGRVRLPNVVRLHEAGEHNGRLYLVLDLIPGGTLKDRARSPMPPRAAAQLMETLARTAESLHRVGILHLDIKPSNILVDGPPDADWHELTPLLSDFGIALDHGDGQSESTASGTLGARGTPAFMAPEQVAGRRSAIGPPADVFALGATLYTLLTGRPPFHAATALETFDLLRSRDPVPPCSMVPGLPRDLETICLVALQKDPARRYATAAAFSDDLRRWLDGYPIHARPVSRFERVLRWCRRHPAPAALAAALTGTVLASLIGLTALWRQSEFQRARANIALTRAREGESTAREAVGDLISLLRETIESPERLASERARHSLPVVLDLTAKLRRTPDLAADHAIAIADLEARIANYLDRRGNHDGVRKLLDDAIGLLSLNATSLERDARVARKYADLILHRASLAIGQSRLDDAAIDFVQAERVLMPHADTEHAIDAFIGLHTARVGLAACLQERGADARARGVLAAHCATAEELSRRFPNNPSLKVIAILAEFETHSPRSGTLAQALNDLGSNALSHPALHPLIADCLAREFFEMIAMRRAQQDPAGPEGQRAIATLDRQISELRLDAGLRNALIERIAQRGCIAAIDLRRAGETDRAERITAWMIGIGRTFERRHPTDISPRLLLSRAFEQRAKLAWAVPDRDAVERALRAALGEANIALNLDPESAVARQHLAGLREKYVRLVAAEPER